MAGIAFSITERKETMKEQLEKIKSEALARIEASDALETLNDIRVAYLEKRVS